MMRNDDERIKQALIQSLSGVRASSGLRRKINDGLDRSKRMRRIESVILALAALAGATFLFVQIAGDDSSGSVALDPGQQLPSLSPQPSASQSATATATPAGPEGMTHFISPAGDLEFYYPEDWVEAQSADADSGIFVSWDYTPHQDRGQARAGDMKLEFHVTSNTDGTTLADVKETECASDPSIKATPVCEERLVNDRIWVWSEKILSKDFDAGHVMSIKTIAQDQLYSLTVRVFRGDDATASRIRLMREILGTARINE